MRTSVTSVIVIAISLAILLGATAAKSEVQRPRDGDELYQGFGGYTGTSLQDAVKDAEEREAEEKIAKRDPAARPGLPPPDRARYGTTEVTIRLPS